MGVRHQRRNNRMRFRAVTCLSRCDLIEYNRHQVVAQMNAAATSECLNSTDDGRATLVHLLLAAGWL